ncbi:MAG: hypothetical protein ACE5JQ_13010 [Candidatus Methylomirabilales bacterium]
MVDKEAVMEVLKRHLGDQVVEACLDGVAQEIAGLDGEWEELEGIVDRMGHQVSIVCEDICDLEAMAKRGVALRVFRKKAA